MRLQVELWGKSWTCELQPILVNVFFLIVSAMVTKPPDAKKTFLQETPNLPAEICSFPSLLHQHVE